MTVDQTIRRTIERKLLAANELEKKAHTSSGKLSASRLFWPTRDQILYSIGVKPPTFDGYTLAKFARGKHVEDFIVSQIDGVVETQKEVEYKGVVGYVDAIVDSSSYEYKNGIIPHEIKSVVNSKYKWIEKRLEPDDSHAWQATLYALALGKDVAIIDYVASDDYRVTSFVIEVSKYQEQVEKAISDYQEALERWKNDHVLPEFVPRTDWQKNIKWATYPNFMGMSSSEVVERLNL